jgi:hypothetical protein
MCPVGNPDRTAFPPSPHEEMRWRMIRPVPRFHRIARSSRYGSASSGNCSTRSTPRRFMSGNSTGALKCSSPTGRPRFHALRNSRCLSMSIVPRACRTRPGPCEMRSMHTSFAGATMPAGDSRHCSAGEESACSSDSYFWASRPWSPMRLGAGRLLAALAATGSVPVRLVADSSRGETVRPAGIDASSAPVHDRSMARCLAPRFSCRYGPVTDTSFESSCSPTTETDLITPTFFA